MTAAPALANDPHLVEFVEATLAASGGVAETFVILSDEEVIALEGRIDPDFTVAPFIEELGPVDPAHVVRFGERSLLLRGLMAYDVRTSDQPGGAPNVDLELSERLRLVYAARTTGAAMIRLTAPQLGRRTACLVAVQPQFGVVEEQAAVEGFHYFTARTYDDAAASLATWALPIDDQGTVQASLSLAADRVESWLLNELGGQARVVDVQISALVDDAMVFQHWLIAHNDDHGLIIELPDDDTSPVRTAVATTPTMLAERFRALMPGGPRR